MWYFAWILGTLLACAFGIVTALALVTAVGVLWDPTRFADDAGRLPALQAMVLIWAICSAVIHGVGFRPQHT